MLYCVNCQILCSGPKCSECGRHKLREPQENDPVYLGTADVNLAFLAEGLLQSNEIPYQKIGRLGAGVTLYTGPGLEEYRFYVPFGAYEKARELMAELLEEQSK